MDTRHGISLSAVVLGACIGNIGDRSEAHSDPGSDPESFACTDAEPSVTVLPRLSREQYIESLRALADSVLLPSESEAVMVALDPSLVQLPQDSHADHARLDQAVTQAHVDGAYGIALAFASQLTATPERLVALVGPCATTGVDHLGCLEDFVRTFGRHVHRRPLTDAEVAFYRDEVFQPATGLDPAAVRDVVTVMLLSPWFLYQVENEGTPVDGREDLFALSPHELAQRLAFHLWNGPPDAQLMEAADSGALATDAGYQAEVDRLLADPRARASLDRFFAEWLDFDDLAPLAALADAPQYQAFLDGFVPTPELRERVIEDSLDLVRHIVWEENGTLDDLFLSELAFAKTTDVASLYGGIPLWQEGAAPAPLPPGERAGLLTRPAMLASGSHLTHSTLRGRDVRRRVLCDELPAPPANAMDNLPELDPELGERARMDALTGSGSCAACHAQMNPIGYTLEGYDALGRLRSQELVFDAQGAVLAELPLDTSAAVAITADDTALVDGGIALSEQVVASGKPHACFARHYFRFTFARKEDDAIDGCMLEGARSALRESGSVADVLRAFVMSPAFRQRRIAQ
jgi:hypothetical protein